MLCNIASFKNHYAFGFWKAALMKDAAILKDNNGNVGHAGEIKSLNDLPSNKILIGWIKEAMKLNNEGIKLLERKKGGPKPEIIVPDALKKELVKRRFNNLTQR